MQSQTQTSQTVIITIIITNAVIVCNVLLGAVSFQPHRCSVNCAMVVVAVLVLAAKAVSRHDVVAFSHVHSRYIQ